MRSVPVEAVGVFRVPFGVTWDIVDIKATILDSCCRCFGLIIFSFDRKHGEIFHHCLMRYDGLEIKCSTSVVDAYVRRCCDLDLVERRNLTTFAFVRRREALECQWK